MAKSGWTDEDEKALLRLLQKKWHSGNSEAGYTAGPSMAIPLESQGAMTDGIKRLREVLDDDEFDMISSAAELVGEQLPVMPITLFLGISDKVLDQLVADQLPEGMSLREWSRTKFAFGKFAKSGKTYRDVYKCTPMMRWQDTANGAWVTLGTKVQDQLQRIGILFSGHAKLWRTLERLESQRVASQGLWRQDSWVIKIVFKQHPSTGNTMSWLFIGW